MPMTVEERRARRRAAYRALTPEQLVRKRAQTKQAVARHIVRKQIAAGATPRPTACEVCLGAFDLSNTYTSPCFDHNHDTGRFRGWLCRNCNSGIGLLRDNPDIVEAAAAYLRARA